MLFLILFILSLVFFVVASTVKPRKFPPGPAWYPCVGSSGILQHMTKKHGSEWKACLELSKQYSTNVLGLKTSSELLVVIFGEDNVRRVLTDPAFDARPHNFFAQLRCLGKKNMGVTFANGEVWKEQRQFLVKTLKRVGYGKTSMEKEIQSELNQILYHIDNGGIPTSVIELLSKSVMNTLWMFVAGERVKEEKLKHLLDLFRQRGNAFTLGGGLLNHVPWCRFIIPELSGYKLINRLNQEISATIEEAISKHKNDAVQMNDFIHLFLQEIYANPRPSFTEEQLKIVCLDLLIAVSITSSNLLGFALLKALNCPDIQENIYREIDAVLGERIPCCNDYEKLIYTSAFLLEVHRYFSIAPMVGPRLALKDTMVDGYVIPKGSTVLISIADIHHNPDLWEDPHVFKPERFIDENGNLKRIEHMYHFGAGRRRCPGEALAKAFSFITLVGILQRYKITCSNGTRPTEVPITGMVSSPRPYTAIFIPRK